LFATFAGTWVAPTTPGGSASAEGAWDDDGVAGPDRSAG
jgi:hypothetical protein